LTRRRILTDAVRQLTAKLIATLACDLRGDVGIDVDRVQLPFASEAKFQTPPARSSGRDEQEKARLIEQLVRLFQRFALRTALSVNVGGNWVHEGRLVELVGIEPTTSSMPWKRSPS